MMNRDREEMIILLMERAKSAIGGAIRSLEQANELLKGDKPCMVEAWNMADVAWCRVGSATDMLEHALALRAPVAGPPGPGPVARIEERALKSRAGSDA